jgi:serine/threonine protein kinase
MVSRIASSGNLRDFLSHRNWGPEIAKHYLAQVAKGMTFLHANNVLHSDLKASNILVDERAAKITDFGLARVRGPGENDLGAGTIGFMAPEVYQGLGEKPADVYSFGRTLYEVFNYGQPAFHGEQRDLVRYWTESGKLPLKPFGIREIEIWELMERTWILEPNVRPTFAELEVELAPWIVEKPDWEADGDVLPMDGVDSVLKSSFVAAGASSGVV